MVLREQLDAILEEMNDAVFIFDQKGITRCNQAALDVLGLSSCEPLQGNLEHLLEILHARFRASGKIVSPHNSPFSLALSGQKTIVELIVRHQRSNKEIYLRCAASPIYDHGQVVGAISVNTNVTNQVIGEQLLQKTLHQLYATTQEQDAIFNSLHDAVFIGDAKGFSKCNQVGLDMLGVDSLEELNAHFARYDEKLNSRFARSGQKIAPQEDPFFRALEGEEIVEEIIIRHLKSGKDVYLRCAASPIRHDGKIIGAVAVNTDITEKIQNQQRLQRSLDEIKTLNKELEGFTYAVSHDLKSPLSSIQGLAAVLLQTNETTLSENDRHMLKLIVQSSQKLSELINQLLTLGKIGQTELKYRHVDLSNIAQDVLEELQISPDIDINIDEEIPAWGDAGLLRSVVQNLLTNAIKYSSRSAHPRVRMGSHGIDGHTVYFIRDNGVGFDMQEAHKLFMPFKRLGSGTGFEGTGVGLSTVKKIIDRHEGRIWAESEPGKGATFYFVLPKRADSVLQKDRKPIMLNKEIREEIYRKLSA
jgi:signal transduction histidine kinase